MLRDTVAVARLAGIVGVWDSDIETPVGGELRRSVSGQVAQPLGLPALHDQRCHGVWWALLAGTAGRGRATAGPCPAVHR
jgi:hypothetical protein